MCVALSEVSTLVSFGGSTKVTFLGVLCFLTFFPFSELKSEIPSYCNELRGTAALFGFGKYFIKRYPAHNFSS